MNYIERKEYNNVISVKIIVPSGCNANCSFCYLNDYRDGMSNNRKTFLDNLMPSLEYIVNKIRDRNPISIDITGNEPTFDVKLLRDILIKLKQFKIKDKVLRTTLTSNGYNLLEVIPYFDGIIDYVNISVHDYRDSERKTIMGWNMADIEYKSIVSALKSIGISSSCVSVIHKPIVNFKEWRDSFISWCKDVGFIGLRFRCDVFWKNNHIFDVYMQESLCDSDFSIITHENTPDSHWCRLRRFDGFRLFFLKGVRDTSLLTKGIEYIISDDGKLYCDYYKRTKIEDYRYEIGKIYDCII